VLFDPGDRAGIHLCLLKRHSVYSKCEPTCTHACTQACTHTHTHTHHTHTWRSSSALSERSCAMLACFCMRTPLMSTASAEPKPARLRSTVFSSCRSSTCSVCVCTCMSAYVYVCANVLIYVCLCMYVCFCVLIHVCTLVQARVYVCVCVCESVYPCIRAFTENAISSHKICSKCYDGLHASSLAVRVHRAGLLTLPDTLLNSCTISRISRICSPSLTPLLSACTISRRSAHLA